jgi:hypothetical protein
MKALYAADRRRSIASSDYRWGTGAPRPAPLAHPEALRSRGRTGGMRRPRADAATCPLTSRIDGVLHPFELARLSCAIPEHVPCEGDRLVSDRLWDDPTIPPPGRRSGTGSWSILPYLAKSLAAKPKEGHPAGEEAPAPAAKGERKDGQQRSQPL